MAAALFADTRLARRAADVLMSSGVSESSIHVLDATVADLQPSLVSLGVPEGEARYYIELVSAGQTLLVVAGQTDLASARETLLSQGGVDVQAQGGQLARPEGAGVAGGTGARPSDVTGRWQDVISRYEMLWQQHYGTSETTWEQMAPVYRYAWELANQPRYRGRPWSEVEATVRADWASRGSALTWDLVAGPIRDVWEDVAEEAAIGAEGGGDRRIPRQGNDQTVAARDLRPPRHVP